MSTENQNEVELTEEDRRTIEQDKEVAERSQFGQSGDVIDTQLGNMGGAGANGGTGPDISHQSAAAPGNSSDLASK